MVTGNLASPVIAIAEGAVYEGTISRPRNTVVTHHPERRGGDGRACRDDGTTAGWLLAISDWLLAKATRSRANPVGVRWVSPPRNFKMM
ncbi:MAG: hypothetical protein MZV65_12835 [Chromatiales bacterium]|nr:hypothetical protein [Chromatiales bacterium]